MNREMNLDDFLSSHESPEPTPVLTTGCRVGDWTVLGFLGRGGSAEVFRVRHCQRGDFAALKVLVRDEAGMRERFRREVALLRRLRGSAFPALYESGMVKDRPYVVLELLEPLPIPKPDRDVAVYLLKVCHAVVALHGEGLVHRDLKPSNVMRRASGDAVLIDLGLAKEISYGLTPRLGVSVVGGKAVGVGTPGFAAPEQMLDGEASVAVDIHALGRMADLAFHGNPPRAWRAIIRRATSSIPSQRYETVGQLAAAIRHRHAIRHIVFGVLSLFFVGMVAFGAGLWWTMYGRERCAWNCLCETYTTNLVERVLLCERIETNAESKVIGLPSAQPTPFLKTLERVYGVVTNRREVTAVRLERGTNLFVRPLRLTPGRDYLIVGPGRLDATLETEGTNVMVRMKNCVVINRSRVPVEKAGVCYVFEGGVSLQFPNLEKPEGEWRFFKDFDGQTDRLKFK